MIVAKTLNRPKTEAQNRKDRNNQSALNADTNISAGSKGKNLSKKLPWAHQNIVGEVKIVEMNKGKRPVTIKGPWFAGQMIP